MRKLLSICVILSAYSSYAQNFNDTEIGNSFKGLRITETYDTLKGTIKLFPQWIMQGDQRERQKLYDLNYAGTKNYSAINFETLTNYNPDNTVYYELENSTRWLSTRFFNLKAPDDPKRKGGATFLHVMEEGPISYFDYILIDGSTPPATEVKAFLQLPNGEAVDFSGMLLGFKNKMSGYVKDFPELSAKIANKEKGYGITNINRIVREYNTWYLGKNAGFTLLKNP